MKKTRISLLFFLLASVNTAFPQTEDITKQFNNAYRAFQSLNQEGKPEESLEFAKTALDLAQSLFDENSETTAALSYNYALNLLDAGQQEKSAEEFSKTVKIYIQVFGRDSESLASVYFDEGRANAGLNARKSRRSFQRGINIIGDIYGTSSLNFADINVQAGIILSEEANLVIAERFFESALNIYENEFGRDNLYTALVNFHLGKYHFRYANVSKSETFLSEAIVGLEFLDSEDDVDQALLVAARGLFGRLNEVKAVRDEYLREVARNNEEVARINRQVIQSQRPPTPPPSPPPSPSSSPQ